MKYKLEIYKAKNKQWSWRLKARNGRIVAVAGETYKRQSTMRRILISIDLLVFEAG